MLDQELGVRLATATDGAIGTQIAVRPRELRVSANIRNHLAFSAGWLARALRRRVALFPNDFAQASRRILKELIESPP